MVFKKIFLPLTLSSVVIAPIAFSTSCSKTKDLYAVYSAINTIKNSIINGNLLVCVNKNEVKINELEECDFKFIINDGIDNRETIKEALDVIGGNIKYLDFYIPRLNDDENSNIVFNVSNIDDESNRISINFKYIYNFNKEAVKINKLNSKEIKELIKEKLNSKMDFISSLRSLINSNIIKNYKKDQDSFESYLNKNENIFIELVSNFISKKYICFDKNYNNIVINDIKASDFTNTKVTISFKISTSEDDFTNSAYEIKQTFFFNDDIK